MKHIKDDQRQIFHGQVEYALEVLLQMEQPILERSPALQELLLSELPSQEQRMERRVARLRRLVRLCARQSGHIQPCMRETLSQAFIGAVYRRAWTEELHLIWQPTGDKGLRGAYQMSLHIAEQLLRHVILLNPQQNDYTQLRKTYFDAARLALAHAERGFFTTSSKSRSVYLSRRFRDRLRFTLNALLILSGRKEDAINALRFKKLSAEAIRTNGAATSTTGDVRPEPVITSNLFVATRSLGPMN